MSVYQSLAALPLVEDITGEWVYEGDWLAVAITSGRSAVMRIGKVMKITDTALSMQWSAHRKVLDEPRYRTQEWRPGGSSIQHRKKKFMKIAKPVDFLDLD